MSKILGISRLELLCAIVLSLLILISSINFIGIEKVCARKNTIGKGIVSSTVRAQEAYHIEHGKFMNSIQQIEEYLGLKFENDYFQTSIEHKDDFFVIYATPKEGVKMHSYVGTVVYNKTNKATSKIVCKTKENSTTQAITPILKKEGYFVCASETNDC